MSKKKVEVVTKENLEEVLDEILHGSVIDEILNALDFGESVIGTLIHDNGESLELTHYEEDVDDTPESIREHRNLLNELHKTYIQKNLAYGNSFDITLDKVGSLAGYTRISDKFNRFENLVTNEGIDHGDESYLDTLIDMANYAIMMYMWEVRNKNK